MSRVRSTSTPQNGGGTWKRYLSNNLISQGGPQSPFGTAQSASCTDDVGYPLQHSLLIEKTHCSCIPLNGTYLPGPNRREYNNWIPSGLSTAMAHVTDAGYPAPAGLATTLLARTNPGRSVVSLPVFIAELRDLPSMVRHAGESIIKRTRRKNLPKDVSEDILVWEFGWKPLFSDLRKMLDFQATVSRRERELNRLYSKGGLRRRMTLGRSGRELVVPDTTIASDLSLLIRVKSIQYTKRNSWGTVRWQPTHLPSLGDLANLRKLARSAVFGGDIQAVDAWNIIPWTWLIDWFTNCGDFLEAYNNRVPCKPVNVCIMTTTETQFAKSRIDQYTVSFQGGSSSGHRITKSRYIGGPGLDATLPFLNGRQLSILSALAIQRHKVAR